jgi:hypothetical protein
MMIRTAISQFEIPDWVPTAVKSIAAVFLAKNPVGQRLLTDPRMEIAWNTLVRSNVAPDALDHCKKNEHLEYHNIQVKNVSLSERACAALFVHTVQEFTWPRAIWTQEMANDFREKWRSAEEMCRLIAYEAPMFGEEFAAAAQTMLAGFEQWTPEMKKGGILSGQHNPAYFQKKKSGDDPLTRGRTCAIARKTRALFGSYYRGTVATITNVGLELSPEIDGEKVRAWCDSMDSTAGGGKFVS